MSLLTLFCIPVIHSQFQSLKNTNNKTKVERVQLEKILSLESLEKFVCVVGGGGGGGYVNLF